MSGSNLDEAFSPVKTVKTTQATDMRQKRNFINSTTYKHKSNTNKELNTKGAKLKAKLKSHKLK